MDRHTGDLGGNGVVGYAVGDAGGPGGVISRREEVEEVVVDLVEVGAVLPRVEQAAMRDLGELAGAVEPGETRGQKGVDGGREGLPVGRSGGLGLVGWEGRGVSEQGLVGGTVPGLGLDGEAVTIIGSAFVMAVYLFFPSVRVSHLFLGVAHQLTTST